jgi:short chain dehydrogenase
VDTCFYGVVYTTRAAVPVMRKQKSGHIFQVSSVGGRHGVLGNTPYHAATGAVGGFSDSLAMEVASFGVKVCTLEPGGIRTNWARRAVQDAPDLLPEYEASVGSFLKMLRGLDGRLEGEPRKIADVIVQLANSDGVPMRLILGVDAEQRVQRAEAARSLKAEKWRHLTVSTVWTEQAPTAADEPGLDLRTQVVSAMNTPIVMTELITLRNTAEAISASAARYWTASRITIGMEGMAVVSTALLTIGLP